MRRVSATLHYTAALDMSTHYGQLCCNHVVMLQFPYILFLRTLFAATSSHPMIVLEFRHISMRLCLTAVDVDDATHAVAAMLRQHGFNKACVVSHSFGTFVASRLCQMHPSLVHSLVRRSSLYFCPQSHRSFYMVVFNQLREHFWAPDWLGSMTET